MAIINMYVDIDGFIGNAGKIWMTGIQYPVI